MLTAAITASIAGLLSLFGIKPGAYLVGVAIAVKIVLVAISVLFGARLLKRRAAVRPTETPASTAAESGPSPNGSSESPTRPASGTPSVTAATLVQPVPPSGGGEA